MMQAVVMVTSGREAETGSFLARFLDALRTKIDWAFLSSGFLSHFVASFLVCYLLGFESLVFLVFLDGLLLRLLVVYRVRSGSLS